MPYTGMDFPEVSIGEAPFHTFDWTVSPWLATGETISTAEITCELQSGQDGNAASRAVGSTDIVGLKVRRKIDFKTISGAVDGNVYRLFCNITTSQGQSLELYSYFRARKPPKLFRG